MIIKNIELTNFRNRKQYRLECKDDTTLILGENGCGKTSVLEAIYILLRGKSFRATDPEIINRDSDFYRIALEFHNGEKNIVTYDRKEKTFLCSDKKTRRLPKKNRYPVILFLPSDLNLVSSSPSRRRDYFNLVFGEFDERYSDYISKYEKALKQRNELLKNNTIPTDTIFSWNVLLARYGSKIYELRKQFVNEINQRLTEVYSSIAENSDEIKLLYKTELDDTGEASYLKKIEQNYEKDHYLGYTSFGVHRDDFIFYFNGEPADGSASRGETRSIILALKFIEADLIDQKNHKKPLILLDDVFSELDENRRKCLIKNFKNHQVIITSVELI